VHQPCGHAGHGVSPARAQLPLQVGGERRLQRRGDAVHSLRQGFWQLPVGRRRVDDLQVEQHPVGGIERRAVVVPALPGVGLAATAGTGELIEVSQGQVVEGRPLWISRRPTDWDATRRPESE
jgi:hypothetical protein